MEESSGGTREGYRNEVSEEEGRGGRELSREEGDGTSGVLCDLRNRADETGSESDDKETVNDEEHEVSGHEGEFDAGVKGNALESSED